MVKMAGTQAVRLTQVVRSTQRIMAGASQFGKADKGVTASHDAEGPPLRTFLFPLNDKRDLRYQKYAQVVGDLAFSKLMETFPGLSWDNRLLIIVPDEHFRANLKPSLESSLQDVLNKAGHNRDVRLVGAEEASAALTRPPASDTGRQIERIILTPISAADGLERLGTQSPECQTLLQP